MTTASDLDSDAHVNRQQLASTIDQSTFSGLGETALLDLQRKLRMGFTWGVWQVPAEFVPDGSPQLASQRTITLASALHPSVEATSEFGRKLWREILRYGICRTIFACRRATVLPLTVLSELRCITMVTRQYSSGGDGGARFWSLFEQSAFASRSGVGRNVAASLAILHSRGAIPDAPLNTLVVQGNAPERDRQDRSLPAPYNQSQAQAQPFPDEFTSQCGWACRRLIEDFAPRLMEAIESALGQTAKARKDGKPYSAQRHLASLAHARDEAIENHKWPSVSKGPSILIKGGRKGQNLKNGPIPFFRWPPRSFSEAWSLLHVIQAANIFVVGLAGGQRASGVVGLKAGCLVVSPEGNYRVVSKAFKSPRKIGGTVVDYPAPEILQKALGIQVKLSETVKRRSGRGGAHLWVQVFSTGNGVMGDPLLNLTRTLGDLAAKLDLAHLLDADDPNVYLLRCRKTLARIVALSVINSPMVLMDLFGHVDPQMTIRRYILSDPDVAREAQVIQRELVIMMAVEAIAESESLSGGASDGLRGRKALQLQRLGRLDFEPQDAYEFARRETLNGRSWMIVGPGIYCTVENGESGLCGKHQVGINPSYCQSGCDYQLLRNSGEVSVGDVVEEIVVNLERAEAEGDKMLVAQWVGQLRNWLFRFGSVQKRWSSHALVQKYGSVSRD